MIKRDNVRVCVPRYLQVGKGSLNELPEIIKILGSITSLLIVTDKQMVSFGYVKKLQDVLSKAGLKFKNKIIRGNIEVKCWTLYR